MLSAGAAWAVTSICVFLSASLAVGAGIGGGALFTAAYILILGYDAHAAVPLSKATIFGLAIAAYCVNIWKRHPLKASRPLIDYDTALMLEPVTLLGTLVGVVLNVLFPNWLVLLPLCVLLFVVSYRTFKKGFRIRKKEQETAAGKAQVSPTSGSESDDNVRLISSQDGEEEEMMELGPASTAEERQRRDIGEGAASITLSAIERKEARLVPWERVLLLVLVWVGYFVISFLLFRDNSLVAACSGGWIVLFLLAVPYVGAITWLAGRMMQRVTLRKMKCEYPFLAGDVKWIGNRLYKYPALAFFAGIAAAMMGIGGGMVKGPIMLAMGIQPQVATATSSFMILFTSSTTTIQYLALGKLSPSDLGIVMSLGFAGALVGQLAVNRVVAKYKKQSFLIFLLGSLTVVSGIIIVATSLAYENFHDTSFNTDELCRVPGNTTST